MRFLFVLFIIVPLIEMWLLIDIGRLIGAPLTILGVVATAAIGIVLLRQQGMATLLRFNDRLHSGELPLQELLEGLLLAVGGALLLTPGFATDTLGFSCLLPVTRRGWLALLLGRAERARVKANFTHQWRAAQHTRRPPHSSNPAAGGGSDLDGPQTIDGEFRRERE